MKNIYSNIFPFNKKILSKTIQILNKGSHCGFQQKLLWLAGNAYSKSIKKII